MPNPYSYLGAAGGAQAGVQGVQALADLLAKQNQQQATAAELDLRRQQVSGEAEYRRMLGEAKTEEAAARDMANQIHLAGSAAQFGNYDPLARLSNQPTESFSRYKDYNNLEELLTDLIRKSDATVGSAPTLSGTGGMMGGGPGGATGGVSTSPGDIASTDPRVARIMEVQAFLNRSKQRDLQPQDPYKDYIRGVRQRIDAGTATEQDQRDWDAYTKFESGQTSRTAGEGGKSAWSVRSELRARINAGEKLSKQDMEDLDLAEKAILAGPDLSRARTRDIPERTQIERDDLARKNAALEEERVKTWNTAANHSAQRINQIYETWSKQFGTLKEKGRPEAYKAGMQEFEHLRSLAGNDQKKLDRIKVEEDKWKQTMSAPPKIGVLTK